MRTLLLLIFSALNSTQAFAAEPPVSAAREPGENWETAARRQMPAEPAPRASSVLNSAIYYRPGLNVSRLPEWTGSADELDQAFDSVRDDRIYRDPVHAGFPRRATWLYTRDGCFVRATHSARRLQQIGFTRAGKVFVFGKLKVVSKYDTRGASYWWFHVVAAYRIGRDAVIFDPAIDPRSPLTLEAWLQKMSSRITGLRVAVCDTYAYGPNSICVGGSSRQEAGMPTSLNKFLRLEWNNLLNLRMNPRELLGDHPPWLISSSEEISVGAVRRSNHPLVIQEGD